MVSLPTPSVALSPSGIAWSQLIIITMRLLRGVPAAVSGYPRFSGSKCQALSIIILPIVRSPAVGID